MGGNKSACKIYDTEKRNDGRASVYQFRFVSLFNGARGPWRKTVPQAEMDGFLYMNLVFLACHLNALLVALEE